MLLSSPYQAPSERENQRAEEEQEQDRMRTRNLLSNADLDALDTSTA